MGFWQFATGGGSGGSGDVAGPAVAVSGNIASFSGVTGKVIADSGVAAASVVVGPSSATDEAFVRFDQATGKLVQNGVLTSADFNGDLTGPTTNTATSGFGTAFTNQPTNDKVTVVSDSALDITQTVTIIGNTNATNSIVTEDIALNGLTGVDSVKADWGQILAVKLSGACAGTVTIQKKTGPATITTIAPAATSAGVFSTSLSGFSRAVSFSSSGATVKHAGIKGTNSGGVTIYEGATLSGTTLVGSVSTFVTVSELYIGDLENNRPLIITSTGGTKLNSAYLLTGTTGSTDDAILISDGTGGQSVAASSVTISAKGRLSLGAVNGGIRTYQQESANDPFIYIANGVIGGSQVALGIGLYRSGILFTDATNAENSHDVGIARHAAGVLRVNAGSLTTIGSVLSTVLVEPNTAGSGSPNIITATESHTVFTNEGSGAKNYHTLVTAAAGYQFTFVVQDADGIRITANTDDTIRVAANVTAAAGYIESTTIGSSITLVAINAVEWMATSVVGTWVV